MHFTKRARPEAARSLHRETARPAPKRRPALERSMAERYCADSQAPSSASSRATRPCASVHASSVRSGIRVTLLPE